MIRNIICDIGGVLITPSEKVTPFIISQMFSVPLEHAVSHYNEVLPELRTGRYTIRRLMEDLQKKHISYEDIADPEKVYAQYYERQAVVNEEVLELIYQLKDKFTLVAFSNMSDLHASINRRRQLFKYFHYVLLSSETGFVKPEDVSFQNVLAATKSKPEECIMIDDKQENIDAAESLGIKGFFFESAIHLKGFIQKVGLL